MGLSDTDDALGGLSKAAETVPDAIYLVTEELLAAVMRAAASGRGAKTRKKSPR